MNLIPVRVASIRDEAIDIKSFELTSATNAALPTFTPGAHIDIHLGVGLVRQYSICNAASNNAASYRIAVKRDLQSRGGSEAMHGRVRTGDILQISSPRNNFLLQDGVGPVVLIGGGIGITPLLSMAHSLYLAGRQFSLHYFTRSIAHTAFHDLLSDPKFAGMVTFHYETDPERVRAYLRKLLWHRANDAQLYLCGPRPFMDLVETTAAATWPPEAVHLEYFGADPASLAGSRKPFKVRLARSGGEYLVAADKSIVEALAVHGITIETSCEQGVCGTCLTGVLAGTPDHRDEYLTGEEKAAGHKICPCVSRAKGDELVLDI